MKALRAILASMRRLPARFADDARGTAAIELALLAPFLALMTTGGFDFGRALYEQHRLTSAARAGIQYAIQSSSNWTNSTGIVAAARADANDTTAQALTISTGQCTCPGGSTKCAATSICTGSTVSGTYVQVTVSESYATLVSYPFVTTPLSLSSQAIVRVQ
jgi:Flp pilus assembly protein TadG